MASICASNLSVSGSTLARNKVSARANLGVAKHVSFINYNRLNNNKNLRVPLRNYFSQTSSGLSFKTRSPKNGKVYCTSHDESSAHNPSPTRKKREQPLKFSPATVIENSQVSADGTLRSLSLSVKDEVTYLEGVRFNGRQEEPRWLDAYQHPGSFVRLRSDENQDSQPFCIANSPSKVHERSATLDASIIEVLVDVKGPDNVSKYLSKLAPGAEIEVSEVIGVGFGSIFNEDIGLMSSMEEKKNLMIVAQSLPGIAASRAVIEWIPVQAHASDCKVTLLYEVVNNRAAAFVAEWDAWREAGVEVVPFYQEDSQEDLFGSSLIDKLCLSQGEGPLFASEILKDTAVLVGGRQGATTMAVTKALTKFGVLPERILYCDFFYGQD